MSAGMDHTQILGGMFRIAEAFMPRERETTHPFDLIENEEWIKVYVEIPGISSQDLSVDFFNNKVKIVGIKSIYSLEGGFEVKQKKIRDEDLKLDISLPLAVTNRNNVRVAVDKGVLCISINKAAEAQNSFTMKVGECPRDEA